MMYPFMTLNDKTEVVHSEAYTTDGIETVKVYFERPVYGGFHSAECYLPSCEWKNIEGFSSQEIGEFEEYLKSIAHIVIRLAREKEKLLWPEFYMESGSVPATRN